MQMVGRGAIVGFLVFASCGNVLYNQRTERRADGWTIALLELKDGPDSYATGGRVTYVAGSGERLLSARLSFRNDSPGNRDFSYDACALDVGSGAVLPGLVDRDLAINGEAEKIEPFAAGEERTRRLYFSYPKGRFPTRVKCGFAEFPLPAF